MSRIVVGSTCLLALPATLHASLLYQWDFTNASGAPSTTAGGGALTANGTGSGFAATGVSGLPGDNAASLDNAYSAGTAGNAGNVGTLAADVLTGGGNLTHLTVTMWVNLAAGSFNSGVFPRVLEIGTAANPDNTNPGLYFSMNSGNFQYGMNGLTVTQTVPRLTSAAANTWVFIAMSYDSTTGSFSSAANNAAYGTFNNTVLLTGNLTSSVTVSNSAGINFTGTSAGPVNLGASAYAFIGNRTNNQRGLTGLVDDVRIYNTQLSIAELEAIRVSALPPPPAGGTPFYWKGTASNAWSGANWTTDAAGTIPSSLLPANSTAAAIFTASGATNAETMLLGANQSVRSITFNADSLATLTGGLEIGGTHNLTIGELGMTAEAGAGQATINTTGQVILGADQYWTNNSATPLTVSSPVSGAFALTTRGTGVTVLSGTNTHARTVVDAGTLRIASVGALGPATNPLTAAGGTLDLNGFNVTVGSLTGAGVVSSTFDGTTTFTVDNADANSFFGRFNNGSPTQIVAVTKEGAGEITLGGFSNFTGDLTVNAGTIVAPSAIFGAPNISNLGAAQTAGRVITVNSGGIIRLASNNVLGNQAANFSLLPTIALEGGTLNSTRYNTVGPIILDGGTLTNASTEPGPLYLGYQFKGDITAEGGTTSVITTTTGRGNHLDANTNFIVATGSTLEVSSPLLNRSGDFANGSGGLTKDGSGTLVLGALNPTSGLNAANTFTGETYHNQGTLQLDSNACLSDFSAFDVKSGAAIVLNFSGEEIVADFQIDDVSQGTGTFGRIGSGAGTELASITGDGLISVPGDPYASWIETYFPMVNPPNPNPDAARDADPDGDGMTNIEEFAFNEVPNDGSVLGRFRSRVETVGANQAFVITLPVRDGAVFAGNIPASASLLSEQLTYEISGSNDLAAFDQPVTQVIPALSADLPGLDFGWTYRTFRLNGNVGGATPRGPQGFLRAIVIDTAP